MTDTITSTDFQELLTIFERDASGNVLEHWFSKNRFFITSGVNECVLRVNPTFKELTISNIQVQHRRKGVATQTLKFLTDYALKKGLDKIILEAVISQEMKRFALKHGFEEKEATAICNFEKILSREKETI
ncbi:GNAT family N-acetyltransferase [Priestia filamentosa]|uniref:GNAT family N-acetyltransferase n=1 Tax=Priestia filamentosa TaxID=1402861 RepID=UPI003982A149